MTIDTVFPRGSLPWPRQNSAFEQHRYDVLTACGPYPSDDHLAYRLRKLRAERASWEAYLDAASATGMLDAELLSRLQGKSAAGWRAGLAECIAVWLFAGKLGRRTTPRPPGRNGRLLDFGVHDPAGYFNVEVKSPKTKLPKGGGAGNDASLLVDCLKSANEQFPSGAANVLVLVPEVRIPIATDRYQLLQAFIGEFAVSFAVDPQTGTSFGQSRGVFLPRGSFVRSRGRTPEGDLDPRPAFTRVSAVVSIEEVFFDRVAFRARSSPAELEEAQRRGDKRTINTALYQAMMMPRRSREPMWVEHKVFVVHNPFAAHPVPASAFELFPQLVVRGEAMGWTDGHVGM